MVLNWYSVYTFPFAAFTTNSSMTFHADAASSEVGEGRSSLIPHEQFMRPNEKQATVNVRAVDIYWLSSIFYPFLKKTQKPDQGRQWL